MCVKYAWLAPRFIFQLLQNQNLCQLQTKCGQNLSSCRERNTGQEPMENKYESYYMILGGRCSQSARSLQISKMLKTVAIPTRLIATSSINHRKSIYQHQSRVIENIYICRLPIFPRDQMQNNANINLKIEYIFDFQIPFQNSRCSGTMEDG